MKKLYNMKEYADIVNRYGRQVSNDYMLPGGAEKAIAAGKLFIKEEDAGVFIFEEREGFIKLTFRVKDGAVSENNSVLGGACLSAFTVNKGAPGKADAWLLANGFALVQERVRYTVAVLNVPPSVEERFEVADAAVAYPIYRACFDMRVADLPCPALFEGALCARDADGKACGVLSLGADRHIGVLPEYRGQGIAIKLYGMLAGYAPQLGTQRLFADVDNHASNGLYKRLGFRTDGVVLRCYVKERDL